MADMGSSRVDNQRTWKDPADSELDGILQKIGEIGAPALTGSTNGETRMLARSHADLQDIEQLLDAARDVHPMTERAIDRERRGTGQHGT